MKVVVAAVGSRGDVQPLAHLADRFALEGHEVGLVTHGTFADVASPAVRLFPVSSDPAQLLASPAARAVRSASPFQLSATRDIFADFIHAAHEPTHAALPNADVVIASTFAISAVDAALQRSVPVVRAHMWPEYPGAAGPSPLVPYGWMLPRLLAAPAEAAMQWAGPYLGGVDGEWRRARLHLTARHPVGLRTATAGSLYAFSPRLTSVLPEDGEVTGWWTSDRPESRLSPEVARALSEADDWVYFGFGSMHQGDPNALLGRVAATCERVGVQAVVQVEGFRGRQHPRVLCVGEEPHSELFRHVRAAVHHGGAGTTGAAVRAGVPSVVVPHFADQFWWASRLHALGVAARPLPSARATSRALARRLTGALEPAIRRRSASLADQVRDEDGCGNAVRWVSTKVQRAAEA